MATVQAKVPSLYQEAKFNKRFSQLCSVGLIATTFGLMSCKSQLKKYSDVMETRIICTVLEPIEWRDADTEKTRADINAYNTVWNYYCDYDRWKKNQEQLKEG